MKRLLTVLFTIFLIAAFAVPAQAGRVTDSIDILTTTQIKAGGSDSDIDQGATVFSSTVDLSSATLTMPGARDIFFDIGAAVVDSGNDVDDASAPNITTADNIPAIIWDDSGETVAVQWTFRVPSDYSTGMTFYAIVSSDDASGAATKLDWGLVANTDDGGFASVTAQDLVACTSATLDASNEVLTLTPDATGAALFTAGAWITIEVFNASTNDDDLELKGLSGTYTPAY